MIRRIFFGTSAFLMLAVAFPVVASAGGDPARPASGLAPTFHEQTAHWTSRQWAIYNAKLSRLGAYRSGTRAGMQLAQLTATGTPINHSLNMGPWGLQQESPD